MKRHKPYHKRVSEIVDWVVLLIDCLIATRIGLELFGFSGSVYSAVFSGMTEIVVYPFRGILPTVQIGTAFWDTPAFFALVMVPVLGAVIVRVIDRIRFNRLQHAYHPAG